MSVQCCVHTHVQGHPLKKSISLLNHWSPCYCRYCVEWIRQRQWSQNRLHWQTMQGILDHTKPLNGTQQQLKVDWSYCVHCLSTETETILIENISIVCHNYNDNEDMATFTRFTILYCTREYKFLNLALVLSYFTISHH